MTDENRPHPQDILAKLRARALDCTPEDVARVEEDSKHAEPAAEGPRVMTEEEWEDVKGMTIYEIGKWGLYFRVLKEQIEAGDPNFREAFKAADRLISALRQRIDDLYIDYDDLQKAYDKLASGDRSAIVGGKDVEAIEDERNHTA